MLDSVNTVREGEVTQSPEKGTVDFVTCPFAYPGAAEEQLSHISFRVERGQTLAVIGATAAVTNADKLLIPRFYDATEGAVLVDG